MAVTGDARPARPAPAIASRRVEWLIAATALVLGAELLTTNVRHLPMSQGPAASY